MAVSSPPCRVIGEQIRFSSTAFPREWRVPAECGGQILVGGLTPSGAELYYLIDFDQHCLRRLEIASPEYGRQFVDYWRERVAAAQLPYGIVDHAQVASSFLQPHEPLRMPDGTIVMAMHNCGYMRLIRFEDEFVGNLPDSAEFQPIMLSATNSLSRSDQRLYFAEWSLDDRLRRYADPTYRFACTVKSLDRGFGDGRNHGRLLIDECIHEVKITPDERHVILTEFCLVARHAPPPYHPDIFADEAAWTPYEMGGLHDSQLYLLEMSSGDSRAIFPRGKTPGHLEFSRSRDGAFYLSCHSLSKAHGRVILHGPGKLLKYELRGHELEETGSYEQPDSWRLTSHVVSSYGGQNFVAVTVFPNRLAIFSDDSFELVREVELFPMGAIPTNGLHFSQLGRRIPIWLTTSSCERFLILVSNAYVYLYDMETGRTSEYANYTVADEMIGTAHIANISPLAQTL